MRVLGVTRQAQGELLEWMQSLVPRLEKDGIELVIDDLSAHIPNKTGFWVDRQTTPVLKEAARGFELVHALGYRSAWACADAFGHKRPWVYSAYDLPKTTHPDLIDRLNLAKVGICSSQAVRRPLDEALAANLEVLYPGVENQELPVRDTLGAKRALGMPEVGFCILSQVDAESSALFGAMDALWAHEHHAQWVLCVGDGFELLPKMKPDSRTKLVSPSEALVYLQAADLVLVSGTRLGFSLLAIKAMSFGVPVMLHSSGGLVEICEPGISGLLFEPEEALGKALIEVCDTPISLTSIGHAGWVRQTSRFTLDRNIIELVQAYKNALL